MSWVARFKSSWDKLWHGDEIPHIWEPGSHGPCVKMSYSIKCGSCANPYPWWKCSRCGSISYERVRPSPYQKVYANILISSTELRQVLATCGEILVHDIMNE